MPDSVDFRAGSVFAKAGRIFGAQRRNPDRSTVLSGEFHYYSIFYGIVTYPNFRISNSSKNISQTLKNFKFTIIIGMKAKIFNKLKTHQTAKRTS